MQCYVYANFSAPRELIEEQTCAAIELRYVTQLPARLMQCKYSSPTIEEELMRVYEASWLKKNRLRSRVNNIHEKHIART